MRKASLHHFIPLIAGMLFSLSTKAQDFNYSFTKDSVAWQELNTQTILNTDNDAWDFSYKIPIGFSFNYLGRNFESLTIETNGYVVFDDDRNYALTAFLGFGDCVDAFGNHPVLGYELSGTAGNRILKIQFKNLCNSLGSSKYFSYQVWLKENGALEIHVGPNDFQPGIIVNTVMEESEIIQRDTTFTNIDSMQVYRVGLLNMNMDTEISGFFIGGITSSPQSQPVNGNYSEPIYMMRAPSQGTRYTFTPNSN
ncbi:MAG: hypothetical protein ABIS12_09660 [Bacteroidia bacterium]